MLIAGGGYILVDGASSCDAGLRYACAFGLLSGAILIAAGLWAPVPATSRRDHAGRLHEAVATDDDE